MTDVAVYGATACGVRPLRPRTPPVPAPLSSIPVATLAAWSAAGSRGTAGAQAARRSAAVQDVVIRTLQDDLRETGQVLSL